MEVDIRRHIINNFKDDDIKALESAIEDSVEENDEIALPGLGVFFELLWSGSDKELKGKVLNIINNGIKKT